MNEQNKIKSGHVCTEGDELYYEVRGQGQPVLMIAPGGGDGWQYSYVADILADEYKVITYDRRANGRSTMHAPRNFEISQQSRDAAVILEAVGESAAFIFGNSSGAVIALDLAKTYPQIVRAAIVHEAPIPRILPDAVKWQRFFARVYLTALRCGSSLAALQFILGIQVPVGGLIKATKGVNEHRKQSQESYIDVHAAADVLTKLELLPVTNYLPDVELIRKNGVKVIIGVGEWALSRKTWYARAAQILAEQFGSKPVIFPGHHGSFMDMPDKWAATLRRILHEVV